MDAKKLRYSLAQRAETLAHVSVARHELHEPAFDAGWRVKTIVSEFEDQFGSSNVWSRNYKIHHVNYGSSPSLR